MVAPWAGPAAAEEPERGYWRRYPRRPADSETRSWEKRSWRYDDILGKKDCSESNKGLSLVEYGQICLPVGMLASFAAESTRRKNSRRLEGSEWAPK